MKKPAPNQAVAELRRRHRGPRALAKAADVSPGTAQKWINGVIRPNDERRELIAAKLGVASYLWDLADMPGDAAGESSRPDLPDAPFEPIDFTAPGAAKSGIIAQLRRAMADIAHLRANPESQYRLILQKEEHLRKLALGLARVSGELAPTEHAKIVRSVQWQRMRDEMLRAIAPWPDALRDLERTFAELEECV